MSDSSVPPKEPTTEHPIDPDEEELNTIRHLIAPLSKEQLIELIANESRRCPQLLDAARKLVDASPASRRLMIRNIAFSTKDEAFVEMFKQFGEIDDAAIVRSKDGHSRGYGFVTCRAADSVKKILAAELSLDGRNLLAKLAGDPFADFSAGGGKGAKNSRRKLFLRNLADVTVSDTFKEIFSKYGELEECVVVTDPDGRSRGYGFVTFRSAEAAIRAVQEPQRIIDDRIVFVAFAMPTKTRVNRGELPSPCQLSVQQKAARMQSTNLASLAAAYSAYGAPAYPVMNQYYRIGYSPQLTPSQLGLTFGDYSDYLSSLQALQAAQSQYGYSDGRSFLQI